MKLNDRKELLKIIKELADNSKALDLELADANSKMYVVWEEPNENSPAHIVHLMLMQKLRNLFKLDV